MPALGRRVAADGIAYLYTDFVQWYGEDARRMWEEAAATEHSHNSTPQSTATTAHSQQPQQHSTSKPQQHTTELLLQSTLLPERRIAANGIAYTYTDFVNWYGMDTDQFWERAAATEHNERSYIEAYALPVLEQQADATKRSTPPETQQTSSGSNDTRTRDATEHSPSSTTASAQVTGGLLQCIMCQRRLCAAEELAFFWRANKQGGVEVHLMLKPENQEPATFIRSPDTEKGAIASWQCTCGFKLGDTRAVAVKKAPMTAFKSSSVMLCGQRFPR